MTWDSKPPKPGFSVVVSDAMADSGCLSLEQSAAQIANTTRPISRIEKDLSIIIGLFYFKEKLCGRIRERNYEAGNRSTSAQVRTNQTSGLKVSREWILVNEGGV